MKAIFVKHKTKTSTLKKFSNNFGLLSKCLGHLMRHCGFSASLFYSFLSFFLDKNGICDKNEICR